MKKSTMMAIALSTSVLLAACGNKDKDVEIEETTPTTQEAEVQATESLTTVAQGTVVTVDYIGRMAGSEDVSIEDIIAECAQYEVFDTSNIDVAQACDLYIPERDYTTGLSFQVGGGNMIPGFELAVDGMTLGETKTVTLTPDLAYGDWSEANLTEAPLSELPEGDYEVGTEIATPFGPVKIHSIDGDTAVIDINHPFAGETLIFTMTVNDIQPGVELNLPTIEEITE